MICGERLHNGENELQLKVDVDGKWENEKVKNIVYA